MTGEKDRFTSHEKLWNLDDKQLSTPKHDELVLSLLNEEKIRLLLNIPDDGEHPIKILSEYPIGKGFIIGYWDVLVLTSFHTEFQISGVGIEIKPTIDSFGKVLRQLNTYRNSITYFKPYDRYVPVEIRVIYLYTPDVRFKDAFESQGIRVVSP